MQRIFLVLILLNTLVFADLASVERDFDNGEYEKVFPEVEKYIDSSPSALFMLGYLYMFGEGGVPKDLNKAYNLFKKLDKMDSASAGKERMNMIKNNINKTSNRAVIAERNHDNKLALQLFKSIPRNIIHESYYDFDAAIAYKIADIYNNGEYGVQRDTAQAKKYFKLAAKAGNTYAKQWVLVLSYKNPSVNCDIPDYPSINETSIRNYKRALDRADNCLQKAQKKSFAHFKNLYEKIHGDEYKNDLDRISEHLYDNTDSMYDSIEAQVRRVDSDIRDANLWIDLRNTLQKSINQMQRNNNYY